MADKLEDLHPEFRDRLEEFQRILRDYYGLETEVESGKRSMATQAGLYAQGRTTRGPIVTGAPPGYSYHNYGTAVDLRPVNVSGDRADRIIGQAIRENPDLQLNWGGNFKNLYDPRHVELGVPLSAIRSGQPLNLNPVERVGAEAAPLGGAFRPGEEPTKTAELSPKTLFELAGAPPSYSPTDRAALGMAMRPQAQAMPKFDFTIPGADAGRMQSTPLNLAQQTPLTSEDLISNLLARYGARR